MARQGTVNGRPRQGIVDGRPRQGTVDGPLFKEPLINSRQDGRTAVKKGLHPPPQNLKLPTQAENIIPVSCSHRTRNGDYITDQRDIGVRLRRLIQALTGQRKTSRPGTPHTRNSILGLTRPCRAKTKTSTSARKTGTLLQLHP